jgi:hypothetical protein
VKLTLTYQGPLPAKQRGVSPIKAKLREVFHPQISAQIDRVLGDESRSRLTTSLGEYQFISPAHAGFHTAVELDILMLAPRSRRPVGDTDNRLKTLIDGLTRPANSNQLQGFEAPADGGPTYCLMDDDNLVQRIGVDSRIWHVPPAGSNEALVVVTASIVLSETADMQSPIGNIFLVL